MGTEEKVKKLTTAQRQRFVYHCPFCGGIDKPSCAYINMDENWKIEHSLKKPWTETIVTEMEEEIEKEVIEDVNITK